MPTFEGHIAVEHYLSGFRWLEFNDIDSTNRLTERLANKGEIFPPTAITAHSQSEGRGQMQTKWHDEPGKSLLLTLYLAPRSLFVKDQFYFNMGLALSVCGTIETILGTSVQIKWPNDILVDKKKIAGILIENSVRGESISRALVGIGLNMEQEVFPEGVPNGTSLKLEGVNGVSKQDLIREIIERSQVWEYRRAKGDHQGVKQEYVSRLFGFGREKNFSKNGRPFTAIFEDILPDGKIVLTTTDGSKAYGFKEVEWIL